MADDEVGPGRTRKAAPRKAAPRKAAPAKKAPAKTAAKKAPAKKAPVKRAPAAKAAPAKKAPAKRAPRKQASPGKGKQAGNVFQLHQGQGEQPPPPDGDVEVFDPALKAHQLRLAGHDWEHVAAECGFPSRGAAIMAVGRMLQQTALEMESTARLTALMTQVGRYEALIQSYWSFAITGVAPKAADVVFRAMSALDRIYRLYDAEQSTGTTRVVIAGSPEEYVASLKQVVAGPKVVEGA